MHKDTYLSYLKDILDEFDIGDDEKKTILEDYEAMIQDALEEGHGDVDLEKRFGDEASIKKQLEKTYSKKKTVRHTDTINALTPFLTFALFMVFGVLYEAWHPGWMVFLLVPLTAFSLDIVNTKHVGKLYMLIPILALAGYGAVGLFYGLWHPGWLILTAGVMAGVLLLPELKGTQKLTALSPFISLNAFILTGYFTGVYAPTWTVFFLVVAVALLNEKRSLHKWLLEGLLIVALGVYFLIGIGFQNWALALFAFLIFIIPAIFTGHIHVKIQGFTIWMERLIILISIVVFFLWGYTFNAWAVSWVAFLTVPGISVILHAKGRDNLIPITVFLTIVIFYLAGYYTGQWNLAWLAFLAIPVVAIIQKV